MAERKAYRNTVTGAIRQSSTVLGYPFEPATAAEVKALPKAGESADAADEKAPTKASGK